MPIPDWFLAIIYSWLVLFSKSKKTKNKLVFYVTGNACIRITQLTTFKNLISENLLMLNKVWNSFILVCYHLLKVKERSKNSSICFHSLISSSITSIFLGTVIYTCLISLEPNSIGISYLLLITVTEFGKGFFIYNVYFYLLGHIRFCTSTY